MVELEISVRADDEQKLPELLEHIMREITDVDYRMYEIQMAREIDGKYICVGEGRYHWTKNVRS